MTELEHVEIEGFKGLEYVEFEPTDCPDDVRSATPKGGEWVIRMSAASQRERSASASASGRSHDQAPKGVTGTP